MGDNTILIKWRVPKTMQWLVKLFFIYLFIFTAFRIATVIFFKPANIPLWDLGPSFWLGLKYDLRWISFILFPVAVISLFKKFNPFYSDRTKKIWSYYLGFLTLLVLFFYGADFGQFAYVNARLNADALIFAEDPQESLQMIWQSYPVIWILIALAGGVLMIIWMFRRTHTGIEDRNVKVHKFTYQRRWYVLGLLILCWFMYGFFTQKPLNFYRAFRLNDAFKSNLALNPLQNFFTTLGFRKSDSGNNAKAFYKDISDFLNLPKKQGTQNYTRIVQPGNRALETEPNIVLVICESFSMYKSSMSGNPIDASPFFNKIAEEGIFFDRCFTPTFGTARGVFATITGIPDVQMSKFSTRNPDAINQKSIINSFDGYDKHYFIGGRSQFNNFGELLRNVEGIQIHEEGSFSVPPVNVWGISDKDLFSEANKVMSKADKPFFSIIQTADNHRPYTIPTTDTDFKPKKAEDNLLKKYGFENQAEYAAFAYADYSMKKFLEAAAKEKYFDNTIFVFIGDHGVEGDASALYPDAWQEQRLTEEHVPLLFYAPRLLQPQRRHHVASQIDVLPTIAGLVQQPYTNSTLGRDLLDSTSIPHAAFIIYHAPGWIGVVTDSFYYRKNLRFEKEELVPVTTVPIVLSAAEKTKEMARLSRLTSALYETSKWMLLHNKR